jgi:hypothetical protein
VLRVGQDKLKHKICKKLNPQRATKLHIKTRQRPTDNGPVEQISVVKLNNALSGDWFLAENRIKHP